ncbi:MAG: hypothetical protein IJ649_04020, partial [Oscillospiraceae bacterium]|nr:hypothetical protein [Oscillospiraceae bacterium]
MPKPQSNVINLHFYALAKPEFDKTIRIVNELQKTEKGEHNYEVRGQIRDALATAMGYAYVAQKHGDYLIMSDEDRQALLNAAAQETVKLINSGALDDLTRYMPVEQLGVLLNPPQEWSPKGYCEWFEKNLQEHLRGGYVREQMDRTIKNTLDLGLSRGEDGSPGWDPFDGNRPWGEEKDRVITGFARARVLLDILNTKADFTQDSKPMSGAEIFHDIDRRETELRNTPGFQAVMDQTGPADMVELLAKRKKVMGEPWVEARTLGNFNEEYDRRVRFYLAKAERVAEEKAAAEAKRKEEEAKRKAEAEKKAAEEAKQKAEAEQRAAEEKKWKDDVRQRAAEEAKLAEDAFTRGEISVETAKYHVATLIALERMGAAGKKSPEATVQSELDAWRKKVMDGRALQRVTEDKSGAEIAAICGKFDAEGKTFKAYAGAELEDSFAKAVATRIQNRAMLHIRERITKGQFDVKDAKNIRSNLSYAFVTEDILNGTFKPGKAPLDSGDWKIVTDKADSLWKQSSFKQLRNKSREDLAKLCGTYDPETHEFKLLPKDEIFKNVNAERERYSEQKKQEKAAAEKKAAEEKAAAEKKAAEEQAAREAEEKKAEAERRAAREAHLKEQKRKFGISASGKEPNLTAFGYFLDGVDRSLTITLPDLDSGRPLSARTMENIGMTFTDWMSNIQIASDPEYADLQDQPHYRKVVDWRDNTEGYKFRDTPAYKELFRPGRETDVLRIVCGHPDQWKDGKPEVLPYDEVKKNFDEKVRQIEAELKDPEAKKRGEEEKAKLDAAEAPERAKREQARQEAIKEAARLEAEKRRLEREAEEREKKAAREELLRKRDEEAQKDALSDEEISGLDVQQVGKRLGDEIRKIETFLNGQHMDLISEWLWNAIDYFKDAKGNEDLKAGIQEAEGAFNREIRSEKKTLGDFAREEHVLGPNFDRLMKCAVELASMERQVDEKAEEARLKEEQEKKAAEEARLKEEQEKKAAEEARLKEEQEKKAA